MARRSGFRPVVKWRPTCWKNRVWSRSPIVRSIENDRRPRERKRSAGMQLRLVALMCAMLATPVALAQTAPEAQSAAEKLYAELASLPQAERTKRLEEGARKEGAVVIVHTLRGELGN